MDALDSSSTPRKNSQPGRLLSSKENARRRSPIANSRSPRSSFLQQTTLSLSIFFLCLIDPLEQSMCRKEKLKKIKCDIISWLLHVLYIITITYLLYVKIILTSKNVLTRNLFLQTFSVCRLFRKQWSVIGWCIAFTATTMRNVVNTYLHGNSIFTVPEDAKSDRTVSRYIVLETQLHVWRSTRPL